MYDHEAVVLQAVQIICAQMDAQAYGPRSVSTDGTLYEGETAKPFVEPTVEQLAKFTSEVKTFIAAVNAKLLLYKGVTIPDVWLQALASYCLTTGAVLQDCCAPTVEPGDSEVYFNELYALLNGDHDCDPELESMAYVGSLITEDYYPTPERIEEAADRAEKLAVELRKRAASYKGDAT